VRSVFESKTKQVTGWWVGQCIVSSLIMCVFIRYYYGGGDKEAEINIHIDLHPLERCEINVEFHRIPRAGVAQSV
jgi:hypothetical protein